MSWIIAAIALWTISSVIVLFGILFDRERAEPVRRRRKSTAETDTIRVLVTTSLPSGNL